MIDLAGVIEFRVDGEPVQMPKEQAGASIYRDKSGKPKIRKWSYYRQRKKGRSWRDWKREIELVAHDYMRRRGVEPFGKDTALVLVVIVYRTMPKSYRRKTMPPKKPYPNITPDADNLAYLPTNALKGICYHDDYLPVTKVVHKRWADENRSPGIKVVIFDLIEHPEYLEEPWIMTP